MKEGRHRPYLTVNPWSPAYHMLVKEGFLGLTMTPADPDARQQMVIVHGVSTAINVDLLSMLEAFFWLKRRVVAGEPRPQPLGLVEGALPSSVHLHGLGRFHMGLYTPEPDLCSHCCTFLGVILPPAAWKRYVLAPESSRCVATTTPLRATALLGPGPSGSHRPPAPLLAPPGWFFGPTSQLWSNFPALPLPAAQPSAFPPLLGTAAPAQSGAAHPPVPATRLPVPVPHRTAPYYAAVVGAEDAAPTSQAGVPATLQDVVHLLLGIQAEVRDLRVRVTALERQRDAARPPPKPVPAPVQPAPQPAHKNQPQSVPASPRPQPVSATVQPAPDNKPQSVPARPRPQPMSATVQLAQDNKPQSAPASLRPQPVYVPVHPSPRSAPDSQPQGVLASTRPQRLQPPATVQPPLPPAPAQPLSVPDRTPLWSGSPSVETDLVSDDMDTDEEEWVPTAARTLDRLQAELATVSL
ncbi:leucine-rich repeat extensin-like protein 3 [Portunus trituberculatus]|uniref:leucine-rich repeat extensin-like protein 3 n=1 Tax=Portunus trituberculatus TaxID=210409 RepID=UPI001E1CCAEB|nr:leucine-rich repeat extensin-like protein 3 [Portunus trituberculatus]